MKEDLYNKTLYKLFLILVKYLPFIIAVVYFICIMSYCIGIELNVLMNTFFLSPTMAGFILIASFVFKACIWHRLPIYYSLVLQIINTIDYYSPIIFTNSIMLYVYLLITIVFILIGMYLKEKRNVKNRTT